MTNQQLTDEFNRVIEEINKLIRRYSIPGILAILIGFGLFLLLLTYLPYIVGILVVVLLAYFGWTRLR